MEENFTCERYHCTMKRKHCLSRHQPGKLGKVAQDTGCANCEQGVKIAAQLGVIMVSFRADRTCVRCGETKPIDEFRLNYTLKTSRDKTCKDCRKKDEEERQMKRLANM